MFHFTKSFWIWTVAIGNSTALNTHRHTSVDVKPSSAITTTAKQQENNPRLWANENATDHESESGPWFTRAPDANEAAADFSNHTNK